MGRRRGTVSGITGRSGETWPLPALNARRPVRQQPLFPGAAGGHSRWPRAHTCLLVHPHICGPSSDSMILGEAGHQGRTQRPQRPKREAAGTTCWPRSSCRASLRRACGSSSPAAPLSWLWADGGTAGPHRGHAGQSVSQRHRAPSLTQAQPPGERLFPGSDSLSGPPFPSIFPLNEFCCDKTGGSRSGPAFLDVCHSPAPATATPATRELNCRTQGGHWTRPEADPKRQAPRPLERCLAGDWNADAAGFATLSSCSAKQRLSARRKLPRAQKPSQRRCGAQYRWRWGPQCRCGVAYR